jgi:hypothetical protein
MERHDWASGSRDCGRAQITQICTHTGATVTRQSAAPIRRIWSALPAGDTATVSVRPVDAVDWLKHA